MARKKRTRKPKSKRKELRPKKYTPKPLAVADHKLPTRVLPEPVIQPDGTAMVNFSDVMPYPFGRYRSDGCDSAEALRDDILRPLLEKHGKLALVMGPTACPSFMEEAFGGLVRAGFTKDELADRLKLTATDAKGARYVAEAQKFIDEQDARDRENADEQE